MRRTVIILVVLVAGLSAALAVKLRAQEEALHGPSGGSGEIEGTELDLSSRLAARIEAVHVRKGDQVKQGDLLLRLDCADPEAAVAEAEARLAAARAQAEAAHASVEASRRGRQASTSAGDAARAQAEALAAQRDAARRQAKRLESLASDVAASNRDQAVAQASGLDHQVQAALAQADASDAQSAANVASTRAARSQAEAAEAAVRATEAAVSRAKLMVRECEIVAPRDAVVAEAPREAGELVSPGAVVVRLLDLSEVRATFYLPNAELAAARPGMKAEVVADAWPGRTFEGVVQNVAFEAEFTPRNIQTRTDRDRLVYPIEVTVQNPELRLRPGMPVQVTLPGTDF